MKFDVSGFGHAPVDVIVRVDEDFLRSQGFTKNGCNLIDHEKDVELLQLLENYIIEPGGATANALSGIGMLGGKAVFNSRLSSDEHGQMFRNSLGEYKVAFTGPIDQQASSDKVYIFITPDSERTFGTFHEASHNMSIKDLDLEAVKASKINYLEGFMLNIESGFSIVMESARAAKEYGCANALCPNDSRLIRENFDKMHELAKLSEIILVNEDEAKIFTRTDSLEDASRKIRETVPCGAITLGSKGGYFFMGGDEFTLPAPPLRGPVVNTNGAGDQFAAGFLFGIAKGLDFKRTARLALECGTRTLTHHSARPANDFKTLLEKTVLL